MADMIFSSDPLPLNFPQTFLPDRPLLSRLLTFAADGGSGNKLEISSATGIPTGKSTGKVEPMIRFASGMGLIHAESHRGVWRLELTTFGKQVVDEDPYLNELPTQWLCHLLLCRRHGVEQPAKGVADPWFTFFAEGVSRLGSAFTRNAFYQALAERHGQKSYLRSLSGLVPNTYTEPNCLGRLAILEPDDGRGEKGYRRTPAPNNRALYPAYTAFLFASWDALFQDRQQVPLDDLFASSRLLAILLWRRPDADSWIDWMRERSLIRLDSLTGITMALRIATTGTALTLLYDELV